jgi:hypothetical protein
MHPSKFLGKANPIAEPEMSHAEKTEHFSDLCTILVSKRKDAIDARKASGLETVWINCEEAYLGIDDMNRHEFAEARWAKPTSMTGPLTSSRVVNDESRSSAFVRLSSRYADFAAAKLGEIILPIDDKAFSFSPTPNPELIKSIDDLTPMVGELTGKPLMRPLGPNEQPPNPPQPSPTAPPPLPGQAQQAPTSTPINVSDVAQQEMEKAQDCADKAEERIYGWLIGSNYSAETRKVIADASRLGVGVLKGPFPEIKKLKAFTKKGNIGALQIEKKIVPAVKWVDPWNCFPSDDCGEDIHNGEYFFERDYLSEKGLRDLKQEEGYLADQIDIVLQEGPGKVYVEGGNPSEKKNDKKHQRYEIWYYHGVLTPKDMAVLEAVGVDDIPKDQEAVYAIVSMINDTIIKAVINPLDSGSLPYKTMQWSRRPGSWAGVGVIEQIQMPQKMVNASTRALLNNAGLSAGPQIVIDQLGVIPADGSWKLTPNKIWWKTGDSDIEDVRASFFATIIPSVQKEMMGIIEYAMKLAEESTSIPLITQGQTGDTTPETFGAAELQNNNAHTWLRSIGYRFDDQITEPLIHDLYEWLILDPDVPDDEKGDFEINAHGSISLVERAIQEQFYISLLKAVENPAFKLDPAKVIQECLKSKRLDPRKLQFTAQQQQQMEQVPPTPPIQVQVAQINQQTKLGAIQAQQQADLRQQAAEMQQEQQMLQNGGMAPHMANAMARIEQEKIRATSTLTVEQSRAQAELAYAQAEAQMAHDNHIADIQKMQLQRDLMILQLQAKTNMSLQEIHAGLANTAMQEDTKRQLAAAEMAQQQSEAHQQRQHEANLANMQQVTNSNANE